MVIGEAVEGAVRYGVSLFSGAGIGDLGFRAAGVDFLAMCEIERDRSGLAATNFPQARHFADDVAAVSDALCSFVERRLVQEGQELFLLSCTAPCQGMSKNGQGTLLKNIREGKRPELDPRNRLILPGLDIIKRLKPLHVVFENVVEMRNTCIKDNEGRLRPILDVIEKELSPDYTGRAYSVEFADYGVPQRRQRLITVYSRDPKTQSLLMHGGSLIPAPTHAQNPASGERTWVSVTEALKGFCELDASLGKAASDTAFHRVPVLDAKKYEWVRHTPPQASAFDNQCVNPGCRFDGNLVHGTARDESGINRGKKETPLYCVRCGSLLPRPYTEEANGTRRIMSGFTSAYKRMAPHLPAPALTRNLSYACSDQKLHPSQNRVLSLAEAMALQTISDYSYRWQLTGKGKTSDALIRNVIGESVPPRFFERLGKHLISLSCASADLNEPFQPTRRQQLTLALERAQSYLCCPKTESRRT